MSLEVQIRKIIDKYREEIKEIDAQNLYEFSVVANGLKVSKEYLQILRHLIRGVHFKNKDTEIHFFKYQKPFIYSRLKFYSTLYNFLLNRPSGSITSQCTFIDREIKKLQKRHRCNLDFVKYYREDKTTLDHHYFLRGNDQLNLALDTSHFHSDDEFSTSHDNAMADMIAYDLLIKFYNRELIALGVVTAIDINSTKLPKQYNAKWTASKTDLIELIYALQASGAIKNGHAGIKDMATACERIFNIDLGHYYKTYVEIRARKMNRTNFIDDLKTHLEQKMRLDDNKNIQ